MRKVALAEGGLCFQVEVYWSIMILKVVNFHLVFHTSMNNWIVQNMKIDLFQTIIRNEQTIAV